LVTGVNWITMGRENWDRLVECLLCRTHRSNKVETHYAPDGRGGDGGIDYLAITEEQGKVIYQLKYFPEGFTSAHRSRRAQIRKSFDRAMKDEPPPDVWVLVVPGKPTSGERSFVMKLGEGKSVKIEILNQTSLDDLLSEHQDIWEYFRFASDVDYLYAKAQNFAVNPVIRNGGDVEDHLGSSSRRHRRVIRGGAST
jgi:hypothetical protein